MPDLGPDERALLEGAGSTLYGEVLQRGGIDPDDPLIVEEGTAHTAFLLLEKLGLIHFAEISRKWVAQDPSGTQSRIIAPLSTEGARLLSESAEWSHALGQLSLAWRKAPPEESTSGSITYLRNNAITSFINGALADCTTELLTAQPQTGRRPGRLEDVIASDRALLERGVSVRTLYQHSARRSTHTREYVAATTKLGGETRTLDEFFNRMFIYDRSIALIPAGDDLSTAVAIRDRSVVAYLADIFMRAWERAKPYAGRQENNVTTVNDEQRNMTLRMLIEGHSDPGASKRLGVSPRTYAGYIADLKDEFEVETRFQLGYELGKRGITGTEGD